MQYSMFKSLYVQLRELVLKCHNKGQVVALVTDLTWFTLTKLFHMIVNNNLLQLTRQKSMYSINVLHMNTDNLINN